MEGRKGEGQIMEKELVKRFKGTPVRVSMGKELFTLPPGIIEEIGDDYFIYKTPEKTSVLSLSELKQITPV